MQQAATGLWEAEGEPFLPIPSHWLLRLMQQGCSWGVGGPPTCQILSRFFSGACAAGTAIWLWVTEGEPFPTSELEVAEVDATRLFFQAHPPV